MWYTSEFPAANVILLTSENRAQQKGLRLQDILNAESRCKQAMHQFKFCRILFWILLNWEGCVNTFSKTTNVKMCCWR